MRPYDATDEIAGLRREIAADFSNCRIPSRYWSAIVHSIEVELQRHYRCPSKLTALYIDLPGGRSRIKQFTPSSIPDRLTKLPLTAVGPDADLLSAYLPSRLSLVLATKALDDDGYVIESGVPI